MLYGGQDIDRKKPPDRGANQLNEIMTNQLTAVLVQNSYWYHQAYVTKAGHCKQRNILNDQEHD